MHLISLVEEVVGGVVLSVSVKTRGCGRESAVECMSVVECTCES